MKTPLLAFATLGLSLTVFGQGAVIIDNGSAPGLVIDDTGIPYYSGPDGARYSGLFNLEVWYKNGNVADTAINSLAGNPGAAYALLTADGFSLATRKLSAGTAVNGIFSGIGEVDIKAPGGSNPTGQAGPGLDRTVAGGDVILGVVIWTGSAPTPFLMGDKVGVTTFVNPTSDWTIPPPSTPLAPVTMNFPGLIFPYIPEPSALVMVGLGSLLLLVSRRKRTG